jgi:hypothetical protein
MPTAATSSQPFLSILQPLIGAWTMRITWSDKTHKLVGGPQTIESPASFEWVLDGSFVHQTAGASGAPVAHWMMGGDETSGVFSALYADTRGVSRLYEMSFADGLWKIWRNAPGFHQRFTGRISADGKTIESAWEKSEDGSNWEHDFDLVYIKTE